MHGTGIASFLAIYMVIDVDAQVSHPAKSNFALGNTGYANEPPLQRFLKGCYEEFKSDNSGAVADYIPELKRANPAHFGVGLVTIDGHVYEVGDSRVPFTIQSVSKAFVFALALDMVGEERVAAAIGVEPSGEAFNSIRLTNDNRPFNPMVNAGAIACSGLIHQADGASAFERIREKLSLFAGRELDVDDAVHASETLTGNRNRAIAWLLRNYLVLQDDVDAVLDTYFRQCAILVTARDLAVMAATLANRGVNPVTGIQVISPNIVARTLSVMTSSGMYDYAGEWIYRVGIPAKSGVGGGIVAALPSQFGLGTFSPLPRQPWQQRARPESLRSAFGPLRPAYAQPQRRRPHLRHCRLRHFRHLVAPQPAAARTADSRRSPQRHQGDRTGRRAEFRGDRLCDAAAGRRAAERAAADFRFPPGAGPDGGRRATAWLRTSRCSATPASRRY